MLFNQFKGCSKAVYKNIPETMICASSKDFTVNVCNGDSGGKYIDFNKDLIY